MLVVVNNPTDELDSDSRAGRTGFRDIVLPGTDSRPIDSLRSGWRCIDGLRNGVDRGHKIVGLRSSAIEMLDDSRSDKT